MKFRAEYSEVKTFVIQISKRSSWLVGCPFAENKAIIVEQWWANHYDTGQSTDLNDSIKLCVQIENEYGSYACDENYKNALRDKAWQILGTDAVLFTSEFHGMSF